MAYRIPKSQAPVDLQQQVDSYIKQLKAHQTTTDAPAPVVPDLVAACVLRVQYPSESLKPDDYHPDFEVYEDKTLADKKRELYAEVEKEEIAAIDQVCSPGRRRLNDLKAKEINTKQEQSHEDLDFLLDHSATNEKVHTLQKWAAERMVEIDDLTEEAVDTYIVQPFPSELVEK